MEFVACNLEFVKTMFIDEAIIKVEAGKGGAGLVSFRREKFVPMGGPDGGDGGQGGNIYLVCKNNVHTLSDFARLKSFKAPDGEGGKRNKGSGRFGDDLILPVSPGTVVYKINGEIEKIADLTKPDEKILIARGGRGGKGNVFFATAQRQAPKFSQSGLKGEAKTLKLELKLIAEVGLIGLPNVGKSTILSRISKAHPKIADYPFTTLSPNLGVARVDKKEIIFADIPGLIEGASKGRGLGDKFLRHIERTKILVHILEATSQNLENDYQKLRKELYEFNPSLLQKPEIIVVNKIDTMENIDLIKQKLGKLKPDFYISAVTGKGIDKLLYKITKVLG